MIVITECCAFASVKMACLVENDKGELCVDVVFSDGTRYGVSPETFTWRTQVKDGVLDLTRVKPCEPRVSLGEAW